MTDYSRSMANINMHVVVRDRLDCETVSDYGGTDCEPTNVHTMRSVKPRYSLLSFPFRCLDDGGKFTLTSRKTELNLR
jgi:hypothetical protein